MFDQYASYYDVLYADKDYIKEAAYVHELVQRDCPRAKQILEFGCGTGKHALALAELGYVIHGIDYSQDMLEIARRNVHKNNKHDHISLSHADVRTVDLKTTFDVVLSLFHVISYQTTNEDLYRAFMSAHKHLRSGGLFVFDCWYGPGVVAEGFGPRVKQCENETIKIMRVSQPHVFPNDNRVDVHFTMYVHDKKTGSIAAFEETHPMRYLFKPEIEFLCKQTGFSLIATEEWLTGKNPEQTTWNVCFVGRKL